jgi:hypothetical protein
MTAVQKMQALSAEYAKQVTAVREECGTLAKAQALMQKWGESSLNDAIAREAKKRALQVVSV